MNYTGRISLAASFGFLTLLFRVQAYTTFTPGLISDHGIPIEIEYWDFKRKPIDQMVDVTNALGIKVLAEHNYLNSNNIAFSPYGLMGILVALYEGVDGESSFQIQRSVSLPRDRSIIRIGFRDIHRALKTYFVPEEGFLAGLALNNENVTFSESYKRTIRFYGFELQNEPMRPTNTSSSEITTMTSPTADNTATTSVRTTPNDITTHSTNGPNEETNKETTANMESKTEVTTTQTESATSSTSQTSASETFTTQTEPSTTPDLTPSAPTTTEFPSPSTTSESTSSPTTTEISSSSAATDSTSSPTTIDITLMPTVTETSSSPTTTEITTSPTSSATTESMTSSTVEIIEDEAVSIQAMPTTSESDQTTNNNSTTSSNNSTLENLQRRKKSILDFLFTNPPDIDDYEEYRSFNIGPEVTDNEMDTQFMVNGKRRIEVPYMHYDSVLDYAYLPHLEASALRLPLDSDRYYLLVVLPFRAGHGEIERLLARMARESDLSDVYGALRPRHVRAKVPSFIVKGHVILTTDLQKLGIRDVFEPRQRDFTPLTSQPGVYVRSIEQAVSISIRKYQPDETKGYTSKRRRPIAFQATYPFLYFVMDSNVHVSLMAGKLIDPLNSRIL